MKKMLDEEEMMPKVLAFGVEETGVLLHYCMEHPISRDDLELFQKLAGLPGVSSDYRGGTVSYTHLTIASMMIRSSHRRY